jgi:(p)ppGpp synthase/HD superfamily hydrolase
MHNGDMTTLFRAIRSQDDFYKITGSIDTCIYAHSGTKRKYTGLPYYNHPLRVALATATHPEAETFWIMAALFHDTVEDWKVTPYKSVEEAKEVVLRCSNQQTLDIVLELTNVKTMQDGRLLPRREQKLLDWERLSRVSRVAKIIKMYDRRDNLLDMGGAPLDFLLKYAGESIELSKVCGDADPNVAAELNAVIRNVQLKICS